MKLRLKIFAIMSILMGFALCSSFAQKGKVTKPVDSTIVSQDKIPAEVGKAFKKRFAAATDIVWRLKENNFVVECVVRNIPTEAEFQKDGTWLSTTEDLEPGTLPSACMKSVDSYFQKYTLVSYKRKTESNKDITMIVGVYEAHNVKKKLETKILLDKLGTVIRTIDPEEYEQVLTPVTEPVISDKKQTKQEAKEKKELDKSRRLDMYPIKISENELPSSLLRWVSLRYPDYVYKEILYTEDAEFDNEGNLYRIKIQRSGVGQIAHATVWFTRDGDFLKVDDPFHTDEELEKIAQSAYEAEKPKERPERVKAEKEKPVEVKIYRIVTDEEDVPKEYVAAFKRKYPKVKEVSWGEYEDEWVAYYTDQVGKNEVSFEKTASDSIQWLETKTPVADLNKVSFAIQSYVEKNYPKQASIKQAWTVKSSKVKPYIIVELYDKKEKTTESVEFWQTGKPKGITKPEPTTPEQIEPTETKTEKTKPEKTKSEKMEPKKAKSEKMKPEKEKSEKTKPEKEKSEKTKSEKTKSSKQTESEPEETPQILTNEDAPKEYVEALKLKYPRVKGVTWNEENGDWIAFYVDQSGKNEVTFEKTASDTIQWLATKTPMAVEKVSFTIQTHVEKNYPKQVSIKQAWMVKSSQIKPYIIIELYNKKTKSTETTLEFWQTTGKLKE